MNITPGIIIWVIIGGVAGWLAGLVMKGAGFGLYGNIALGIVGSLIAGWLLPAIGVQLGTGIFQDVIDSAIGAIVALVIIGLVRK